MWKMLFLENSRFIRNGACGETFWIALKKNSSVQVKSLYLETRSIIVTVM